MQIEKSPARERLLKTAADLFFREGFRAVGVDTISAASGVGKMTLYRHFASKDDLIVEYLQESNRAFWSWFEDSVSKEDTARGKLLAFFLALQDLSKKTSCYGCPFLNAAVDFPETNHPGHQIALDHKQAVERRFCDLAAEMGAAAPQALASQLMLLMDGAFMSVRLYGHSGPALQVAAAAQALIDSQIK